MPGATVAATLKANAAPVPMPISVNMFGLRCRDRRGQALEERAAGPQAPTGVASSISTHTRSGRMSEHRDQRERRRERGADPEPARQSSGSGLSLVACNRSPGLERHAADRAGSGTPPNDLGVHRARVLACG